MEIEKQLARQDAHFAINPGKNNETSIKISEEIFRLLLGESALDSDGKAQVEFWIYKADFYKSACSIIANLPLCDQYGKPVYFSYDLCDDLISGINEYFGADEVKLYKAELKGPSGGRLGCLQGFDKTLNVRKYTVEKWSKLTFVSKDDGVHVHLSFKKTDVASPVTIKYQEKQKQLIFYGAPGTGKSFGISKHLEHCSIKKMPDGSIDGAERLFRTTFHPDTDYSSFVGCYKPVQNNVTILTGARELLEIAQAFSDAYFEPITSTGILKFGIKYSKYFNGEISSLNKKEVIKEAKALARKKGLEIKGDEWDRELTKGVCLANWISDIATEDSITYKYVPQVFTEAYVKAWGEYLKNPTNPLFVCLVIEEINRGNCAQIFGDLFQLLDRKSDFTSEYPVKADIDLRNYLLSLDGWSLEHPGILNGNLCLPANLTILATMNTSDQSLFPMDSAFKRRWDWKYVPTKVVPDNIQAVKKEVNVIVEDRVDNVDNVLLNHAFKNQKIDFKMHEYSWSTFLKAVNERIRKVTHSDDKLLGYWFIKGDDDGNISVSKFVSKVVFYLWNDVFKEYGPKALNPFCIKDKNGAMTVMSFNCFFDENTGEENIGVIHTFMANLGLVPDLDV